MRNKERVKNYIPFLLFVLILVLLAGSVIFLVCDRGKPSGDHYYADIISEGNLVTTIPLWQVETPYTLEITCKDGGKNTISIASAEISVISATCPDQICVRQGAVSDSRLPIVCLPNRLVIQLREATVDPISADGYTY